MNMTSSRKDSSSAVPENGPLPAKVPHTAKHERTSAPVAVSRWPQRSAAHNSGRTTRNPNELR